MEELLVPAELGPRLLDLPGQLLKVGAGGHPSDDPIESTPQILNWVEVTRLPDPVQDIDVTRQINKAWAELGRNKELLHNLTDSMPARIAAVIEANSDVTKY